VGGRWGSGVAEEEAKPGVEGAVLGATVVAEEGDQGPNDAADKSEDKEEAALDPVHRGVAGFAGVPVCCDSGEMEQMLAGELGEVVNARVKIERRDRARRSVTCLDGEIRQVLSNLIGNAIDAMFQDDRRLLIRSRESTDWHTGRRGVTLTVADTGSGMSTETISRIFEPFFTTKGHKGTGLGLLSSCHVETEEVPDVRTLRARV
jgi:signal transduction histidine kinase